MNSIDREYCDAINSAVAACVRHAVGNKFQRLATAVDVFLDEWYAMGDGVPDFVDEKVDKHITAMSDARDDFPAEIELFCEYISSGENVNERRSLYPVEVIETSTDGVI